MPSYPNAHAIASMHLEPAAPVYNTLPCCDSMQMSHARCHTGTRHELSHSATWCCSPMKTWTPLPAAMRRMQVQVRRIVACVMPPVFYLRRPACGHAGGRDSKEQELRRTGSAVLALMNGRKASRKRYNSFDAMRIERERSMTPPQWFACSTHAETNKVARLHTVRLSPVLM